jgi:hypothetical protein
MRLQFRRSNHPEFSNFKLIIDAAKEIEMPIRAPADKVSRLVEASRPFCERGSLIKCSAVISGQFKYPSNSFSAYVELPRNTN